MLSLPVLREVKGPFVHERQGDGRHLGQVHRGFLRGKPLGTSLFVGRVVQTCLALAALLLAVPLQVGEGQGP